MTELNICIVSWCPTDRPARVEFLNTTLRTLFQQLESEPSLLAAVHLVDNGSVPDARAVIEQYRSKLTTVVLWPDNRGINAAYEELMSKLAPSPFTMMLDADMELFDPLSNYLQILRERPDIGASGGQHSPEHETCDVIRAAGRGWLAKRFERGSFLVFRTADLNEMRPFPISQKANWDWHVCQWSQRSLEKQGKRVAVLPGGARHLGWRRDDGTWMNKFHQEWPGMYGDSVESERPAATERITSRTETVQEAYQRVLRDATDIREHLPILAALASGMDSAATLGHDVSTMIAFLQAGVPSVRNYHYDERTAYAMKSIRHSSDFKCVVCDVRRQSIEPTDLLAIDSLHTYEQLFGELNLHSANVSRVIVMHDTSLYGEIGEDGTAPGLQKAINDFLAVHPEWVVTDRRMNNNGLTVLSRRRLLRNGGAEG